MSDINIDTHTNSWISPRLESRIIDEKGGHAVFACEALSKGTLLAMWGGTVVAGEQLGSLSDKHRSLSIQVDDDLYLVSTQFGAADHFNHSCDPNSGLYGQIGLVAMRDIVAGEEVTFDYAMSDSTPYDEFECFCTAPQCRKRVTGDDWRRPDLQERYDGYFSLYLQRRIDQLRK